MFTLIESAYAQVTTGPTMGTEALTNAVTGATNVLNTGGQAVANNVQFFFIAWATALGLMIVLKIMRDLRKAHGVGIALSAKEFNQNISNNFGGLDNALYLDHHDPDSAYSPGEDIDNAIDMEKDSKFSDGSWKNDRHHRVYRNSKGKVVAKSEWDPQTGYY